MKIRFTAWHNPGARHNVADIGLLAAKVGQCDDPVEGYDLNDARLTASRPPVRAADPSA